MRKGIVFGLDLMLSLLVTLAIVFFVLADLNGLVEARVDFVKEAELKQKALFFADSLIKNSSSGEPWIGAAFFDPELKRARANVLDEGLLKKIKESSAPKEAKKIYLRKGKEKAFFLEKEEVGECVGIERIVLAKKGVVFEKSLLGVVVCSG